MELMIDTALAVTFAIGLPLVSWPIYRRRRPALQAGNWDVKRREYAETIAWLTSMGLVPLLLWFGASRDFALLGLDFGVSWQGGVSLLFAAGLSALLFIQVQSVRRDPRNQEAARKALTPVAEFLPQSATEARWFRGVSVAAGVGEEIFYRGFLLWYLESAMPLHWAVATSSVLFGLAHVMHGVQATVRATIMGLVLAALYVFSGALWAPMLLHTVVDLTSGETALAAFGKQRAAPA